MRPFAQLGKSAATRAITGQFNNPFATTPAAPVKKPGMGWADWGDIAAGLTSFIPGAGGVVNGLWQGGRAAYHAATGNYGRAAESLAYAGLGFVPGAVAAAQGAKGLGMAARLGGTATRAGRAATTVGTGYQRVGQAVNTATSTGRTLYNGGKYIKPITTGKLAVGAGSLAVPTALGTGVVPGLRNAAPAAQPAAQAALNPGTSWGHLAASITAGGPPR